MNLPLDLHTKLEGIKWFAFVGREPRPDLGFPVTYACSLHDALIAFNSPLWEDAKTEAQGDLTGYLSRTHYEAYGGHWNKLGKESGRLLEKTAKNAIADALADQGLQPGMLTQILLDLNRAALEIAYRRKFPKAPVFFERLLLCYESGRLPCGWDGDMRKWPEGNIIVF
jgi:hypothetical protein